MTLLSLFSQILAMAFIGFVVFSIAKLKFNKKSEKFNEGQEAYKEGNYKVALEIFKPMAEKERFPDAHVGLSANSI